MTTEKRKCGCSKGPMQRAGSIIQEDTSPTAKICITSEKAPLPVGPYSQAVKLDKTVYVSGCLGLKLDTGTLIEGGAAIEARLALKNMGAVLEAAGSSYNNVLKTTIYLTNMEDCSAVNDVYKLFFYKDYPARSCVQVSRLPLDATFEIEAIATIIPGGLPAEGGEQMTAGSVKEPSAKEASVKEPSTKEASMKEPSAKEASVKEPSTKEASVKEPSAKEASVKELSTKEASLKDSSAKESSVKEASAKEEASALAEEAPSEATAEAPAEEAPAEAPAEEAPAEEAPAEEAPAEEAPAEEAPAEEAPAEAAPEEAPTEGEGEPA